MKEGGWAYACTACISVLHTHKCVCTFVVICVNTYA